MTNSLVRVSNANSSALFKQDFTHFTAKGQMEIGALQRICQHCVGSRPSHAIMCSDFWNAHGASPRAFNMVIIQKTNTMQGFSEFVCACFIKIVLPVPAWRSGN